MTPAIYLVKGRDKSLRRKHPWVFSRGISKVEGTPKLGETVDVYSFEGKWLAKAAYSPHSQITARVWSFEQEPIDRDFFIKRIEQAQLLRNDIIERDGLTGYRLIAAESDGLPGITIDKYQDYLVCQLLSAVLSIKNRLWSRHYYIASLSAIFMSVPMLRCVKKKGWTSALGYCTVNYHLNRS